MRLRRVFVLAAWAGSLVGAGAVLLAAGRGPLALPAHQSPAEWSSWVLTTDPAVVALALLRVGALAVTGYLALITVVGVAVRVAGAAHLAMAVDRVTIPVVRRLLGAWLGASLAIGPTVAVVVPALRSPVAAEPADRAGSEPGTTGTPPPVMRRLPATSGVPVMRRLPPARPTAGTPGPAATDPVATDPVGTPGAGPAATPSTWEVRAGESFWSIADAVLRRAWDREPSDAEVVPYWRRLIESNRRQLRDPANPDLVFAGQVFTLPPV